MTEKNVAVLLVEDNLPDARYVQELLPKASYTILLATSLAEAHDQLAANAVSVVLLDLSLPDGSGLESFLSVIGWTTAIPIIVLTGLDDEDIAARAVNLGAQDYVLKKEISQYTLSRAIRYAIERKQAEENSKRLAILEQHEEFMATLTHDLKNPLIGANRILELIADQAVGVISVEQVQLLLQLRDNNKTLLSMIQNLIEVYKFEKDVNAVWLQNTNLLHIVLSCITDITPIASNRDIRIRTEFPDRVKEVMADASAIRRVVQNLLDNALKFTPNGGQISLEIRPVNGDVAIQIEDTGPGIPPEEQKRLFKRFSQGRIGKRYTPGTGLGLYLCKQIVDAHKGRITCSSTEGLGTTFRVTLPAA